MVPQRDDAPGRRTGDQVKVVRDEEFYGQQR